MLVTFATEKAPSQVENEDFVGATPNGIVLLDGAGSSGNENGCLHGVAWYARQLGATLLHGLAREDQDLVHVLADGIGAVADLHRPTCDLDHPGSPSATVVIVRQEHDRLNYLVLADSTLVIQRSTGLTVVTDDREALIGRPYRQGMDGVIGGTPEHDQARRHYVAQLMAHRNRPAGFWVASTDPTAAAEALVGTMALSEVRRVALLSDGASRVVDRFGLAEWPEVMKSLKLDGPEGLIRQVRAAEQGDPTGDRWPRGKIYDDATVAHVMDLQAH